MHGSMSKLLSFSSSAAGDRSSRRQGKESKLRPTSWDDFCGSWLKGKWPIPIRLIIFIFAGFAWALWTTRNKIAIEKKIPKAPTDVLYIALSLMQKWSVKLKGEDQERIMQIKASITRWLKSFKPNEILMSDVLEI